jgi:hypothetical protein
MSQLQKESFTDDRNEAHLKRRSEFSIRCASYRHEVGISYIHIALSISSK